MMVSWEIEVVGIIVTAFFLFFGVVAWVSSSKSRDAEKEKNERSF